MASAATKISFTCPNCAKVLRAGARPPEGKKVKCPACGEPFLPEFDDEEDDGATAIQSKPGVKSKAKAPARDEEDDEDVKPRSKKKRADDEEDEDGPPRRKRRDEDEDEGGRSIKKKKPKKKSGSMMMIVLGVVFLGGGGLLSCGLCGVGAFVWPGFMLSKADLEAFVSADADMVMGANPKLLKAKFPNFEKLMREQGPMRKQEWEDVTFNSERLISFANTKNVNKQDVTIFVSNATDIAKVKRNQHLGPALTVGGHANVHKITDAGRAQGLGAFVAFPGNNIVVVSDQPEQELIAMLTRGQQKPQANATLDLAKEVNSSAFWLAFTPDAAAKREFKQGLEMLGANQLIPMPTLRNAATAVDGIKGFTLAFDFDDKQDIQLSAKAFCKDAGDAKLLKTGIEDAWTVALAGIQLAGFMKQPGVPEIPAKFKEDMGTMKFTVDGSNATAKMKIGTKTIEDLVKLGAQPQFEQPKKIGPGPGPIGPNPFPPGPPPGPFPDPPAFGGPDVTAPPGAKLFNTYTIFNLAMGEQRDNPFQFAKGKRITVTMVSTVNQAGTDVDLLAIQGNAGDFSVASDISLSANGRISFVVQKTGPYRIRVKNLGPGKANSVVVNVYEQ